MKNKLKHTKKYHNVLPEDGSSHSLNDTVFMQDDPQEILEDFSNVTSEMANYLGRSVRNPTSNPRVMKKNATVTQFDTYSNHSTRYEVNLKIIYLFNFITWS